MNGALYNTPQGALMDPRSMALAQMGMGLMGASGPSRMPVSLGQGLAQAGQQGLQAFQQATQMQQQEALRQMQMKKLEEEMRLAQEKAMQPPSPLVAAPGSMLIDPKTRQPLLTVPFKPEPPKASAAPFIKTFREGDQDVTKEYRDGKWVEVARGSAFAPKGTASAAAPKAPTGFRYTDDGSALEPIPGGPKDTSKKDTARMDTARSRAELVIGKVGEALGKVGITTTGLPGAIMGQIPGTDAYDLRKTVDTIKANIGFQELQAMREMSPTGGALGQVAVQELNMLQSVLSSLDEGQSSEQLSKSLTAIKTHFENWKKVVEQSQTSQPTNFPAPPQDAIRRLKMNPKEREQFDAIFGPGAADRALGQ